MARASASRQKHKIVNDTHNYVYTQFETNYYTFVIRGFKLIIKHFCDTGVVIIRLKFNPNP